MPHFRTLPLLLVMLCASAHVASAQSLFDRARRAAARGAERAVDREVTRQADRAAAAAVEALEHAVACAITDDVCIEDARQRGETVVLRDAEGRPVDPSGAPVPSDAEAVLPAAPGSGVWANYDFVPGARVLFYDDYTEDRVGDFPRRLEFVRGSWEVVEWVGRRLLRTTGPSRAAVRIPLPETLPDRFTIETEAYVPHANHRLVLLTQPPHRRLDGSVDYNFVSIGNQRATGLDAKSPDLPTSYERDPRIREALVPIRIHVDGAYVKVYVGENRTANVPNAVLPRSGALYIENDHGANEGSPIYLGPIRVAAGGVPLSDALAAEGRVATLGITFATGSAILRPESTPTLQEVLQALRDDPDLRLRIEGHTDDTGTPEANHALSERRAIAVRAYLVSQGIAGDRLEAVGLGHSQPAADNGSPEGRQQNRRVELVRL